MSDRSKRVETDLRSLSKRVETDVNIYRLRIAVNADGGVVFGWDYPGSTLLRVRILRAEVAGDVGPAGRLSCAVEPFPEPEREPEPEASSPWRVVYDGDTGSFRDAGVAPDRTRRYAVYARDRDGPWTLWRVHQVEPA